MATTGRILRAEITRLERVNSKEFTLSVRVWTSKGEFTEITKDFLLGGEVDITSALGEGTTEG